MAFYFIDSKNGDNSNSGLSPEQAFRSFEKINGMTFLPGDRLLLKKDSVFTGHLTVNGSGTEFEPIEITFYGGGVNKPAILTNDGSPFSLLVTGEYVTVCGIEVSNERGKNGILLKSGINGATRGVTVSGCHVHNVWTIHELGIRETGAHWQDNTGGISVESGCGELSRYEGLRIEHNTVENVNRTGIRIGSGENTPDNGFKPSADSDIYIGYNRVDHAWGSGIVAEDCDNLLIEHNRIFCANCKSRHSSRNIAVWSINCNGARVRCNEVAYTGIELGDGGGAFGIERCCGSIYEYNFSRDNAGGFISVCSGKDSSGENIIRNNLSVNDAHGAESAVFEIAEILQNVYFLNNTVYNSHNHRCCLYRGCGSLQGTVLFANNLFYSECANSYYTESGETADFEFNYFYNFFNFPKSGDIKDSNIYSERPVLSFLKNIPFTRAESTVFIPKQNSPLLHNGRHFEQCSERDFFGLDTQGQTYIGAFFKNEP